MLKRMICLLLVAVMTCGSLCACGKTPAETTGPNSTVGSTTPADSLGLDETPKVVNGVYVTCENYDFTFYQPHNHNSIGFYVITEKPLPEDAHIVLNDITSRCTVRMTDRTDEVCRNLLPEIYWCMKEPNKDWAAHMAEIQRLDAEIQRLTRLAFGKDKPEVGDSVVDKELGEQLLKVKTEYTALRKMPYKDEYLAWKNSNPEPVCYFYNVIITINMVTQREQLKSMELVAGDMSRTITMKNVWLDVFAKSFSDYSCPDVDTQTRWKLPVKETDNELEWFTWARAAELPYGSGPYAPTTSISKFIPKEDMTLKDMYVYGDNSRVKVEWVEFVIINNQGMVTNVKWIPGTEFMLRKGEKVAMRIYHSDPHTQQMYYQMTAMDVLEYECGGETRKWYHRFYATRSVNVPALYLWAFKGLNIDSYYANFYTPFEMMASAD